LNLDFVCIPSVIVICTILYLNMKPEEIYDKTFESIYRFFYYKSVNRSEIEDLVQEVYIRFFRKTDISGTDIILCQKLLYGFSRNIYKEWVRKQIKSELVYSNIDYLSNDDSDPINDPSVEHDSLFLKEAIEKLNPVVRQVITMRFIENLSRKEIADKLNIKEKHVHVYQRRGIKYLRDYFSQHVSPKS
jgi:RNA polymerase sigma-70 factor, ECF subfamily